MNSLLALTCASLIVAVVLAYPGGHDHHTVPHYHFEYGVYDHHTHDIKSQYEHRDHDDVKQDYTFHEPDGTKRIVKYTSSKHGGFQAALKREGHAQLPAYYGKVMVVWEERAMLGLPIEVMALADYL